jgi:hypothetical protein
VSVTNSGSGLESTVIASQGRHIRVDKMPQAARRLPGGRVVCVKGPCDFYGTVIGTGRAIYFDAKVCHLKSRFGIGDRSHVPAHQLAHIIRHGEAGALSGLLVESTALGRFLWWDWSHVSYADKSIPWSDSRWVDLGDTAHAIRFQILITPANGASDHE